MPKIFPLSIIEFSTQNLIKHHSTRSKIIYWILILVLILFAASLFWIKVDVNVDTAGIITSRHRTTEIMAPVFGRILSLRIKENQQVKKGDTLLVIDTTEIEKSIRIIQDKIWLLEHQNSDLAYLTQLVIDGKYETQRVITPLYRQEFKKFISDLALQKSEVESERKEYVREKFLYKMGVAPAAEFEQVSYKFENSKLTYHKIFEDQLSSWQNQFNENQTQLYNLKNELYNSENELIKYFIIAPIDGYIQDLTGVKIQGNIYPNQQICWITPTSGLIVKAYVSPSNIGFLRVHQKVKFRVSAFNYNQWGMLKGYISQIPNNVYTSSQGQTSFIVRCKLESKKIKYKNNVVTVKNGMTVTASFFLARRTLAQLLYDNVSSWLNPNQLHQ